MDKVMEFLLERGFLVPTAKVYGSYAGFFDYGPPGILLRRRIEEAWLSEFVFSESNVFLIDGSVVLPEPVLRASGHLDSFSDPITSCTTCGKVYRADKLVEELLGIKADGIPLEELKGLIKKVKCPSCGGTLDNLRSVNLMFETGVDPYRESRAFLRPETAQNMFLDFMILYPILGRDLPFGLAQIGRSFRNEISPRKGLIRLREFRQMEIEMFIGDKALQECPNFGSVSGVEVKVLTREDQVYGNGPSTYSAKDLVEESIVPVRYMAYYMAKEQLFFTEILRIPPDELMFRELLPQETPHYSGGNFDLEVNLGGKWIEVVGNAYRTDYDLDRHFKYSKMNPYGFSKSKGFPHVIEPSFGVDRIFYAVIHYSLRTDERPWEWLDLQEPLATYDIAIFPLTTNPSLVSMARGIAAKLRRRGFIVFYKEKGRIGKKYMESDQLGIRTAVTVGLEALKENKVTVRYRNTREQELVSLSELLSNFQT